MNAVFSLVTLIALWTASFCVGLARGSGYQATCNSGQFFLNLRD